MLCHNLLNCREIMIIFLVVRDITIPKRFLCDKNNDHDYLGMNFLQWVIHNNYQTFPSSTGEMLHADKLYRNTNIVKELFGNYLPYIDVDCEIDQTWIDLLKLKTDPS